VLYLRFGPGLPPEPFFASFVDFNALVSSTLRFTPVVAEATGAKKLQKNNVHLKLKKRIVVRK
jgi:hypothetical protein